MQVVKRFFGLALLTVGVLSCSSDTQRLTPKQELLQSLELTSSSGRILLGHQDDLFYGKNWCAMNGDAEQSDIRAVAGDYPALLGVEIGGVELGWELSIDKVPFEMIRQAIVKHHLQGGVATISWHAANPISGGNSWDVSSEAPVDAILEGGSHHELFREWLARVADFIASLKDERGEQIPVIWRPWHENVGGWFWWGAPYCSAESYKRLWRETYNYMVKERGMDGLIWAYSPSFHPTNPNIYEDCWPGEDMVDMVGADIYQYSSDAEFIEKTSSQLEELIRFAERYNKPAALSETGYEAIPNPKWWSEVLFPAIEGHKLCYVLLWRNAWDREAHYYAPFPGQISAEDFKSEIERRGVLLLDDYNKIKTAKR